MSSENVLSFCIKKSLKDRCVLVLYVRLKSFGEKGVLILAVVTYVKFEVFEGKWQI